jgi:hypothetical protein
MTGEDTETSSQPSCPEAKMIKWEYKLISSVLIYNLVKDLNVEGQEGWEFATLVSSSQMALLKRPLKTADDSRGTA